jgi:hypothetical protein
MVVSLYFSSIPWNYLPYLLKSKWKSQVKSDSLKTSIAPAIIYANTIKIYLPYRNGLTGSKSYPDIINPVDSLGLSAIFEKIHLIEETADRKENTAIDRPISKAEPNRVSYIETSFQHRKTIAFV